MNADSSDASIKVDGRRAWRWALLWLVFIYGTIPLARTVQEFVRDIGAKMAFTWITFAVFLAGGVWIVRAFAKRRIVLSLPRACLLASIIGLFMWMAWALRANPEEAFHFVQYGILGILIYRALSFKYSGPVIYFAAFMLGAVAGIVDELIQWITPRRFFDFRDIGINVLSGALVQLGIGVGLRPALPRRKNYFAAWRLTFAAAAISLGMLFFCAINTPAVFEMYARYIPVGVHLLSPTAEYGHFIKDPETGSFYSRLRAEELRASDVARGAEVGPWISAYKHDRQYDDFTYRYAAWKHPLAVEARVHIFRRDRYARELRSEKLTAEERTEKARVAHHENLILEKYFPNVLKNSIYAWPPERKDAVASYGIDEDYVSAVSANLITGLSQRFLLILIASLLVAAIAGERWAARRGIHEQRTV